MSLSTQTSVTVQIPASTSNCGPGFDTLAIALSLYNFVRVELTPQAERKVVYSGQIDQREQTEAMGAAVAAAFEKASGITVAPFTFEVWGQIPLARGLGSSSTVRGGLIAALNHLYGSPLSLHRQTQIGCELDGAPDNSTALFYGGFVVARTEPRTDTFTDCLRCDVDDSVSFAVVSPDVKVFTGASRNVLPEVFPFIDATRSINSACAITAAFFSRDYARLKGAVSDFMHQPYRSTLCPFMNEAIAAGEAAGAWCGWLSGSGSSILCVTAKEHSTAVTKAMSKVYADQNIPHQSFRLGADNRGICLAEGSEA